MNALSFRNVNADPSDPVEAWPFEGLVTALERGGVNDWRRIAAAIRRSPWGPVARSVEDYLSFESPYGVAPLMRNIIAEARSRWDQRERDEVAREVSGLVVGSGLTQTEFASRVGTSASRLSTYRSGRVVPSAALMVRMREIARLEQST